MEERERERGKGTPSLIRDWPRYFRTISFQARFRVRSALVGGKLEELWKRSQTAAEFAPLEANRVVRLCPADSRFFNFPVYFFESCSFNVFTVFTLLSLFLSLDTREAVCLSCNVE